MSLSLDQVGPVISCVPLYSQMDTSAKEKLLQELERLYSEGFRHGWDEGRHIGTVSKCPK